MGWFYGTPLWQWVTAAALSGLGIINWLIPDGTICDAIYFSWNYDTQEVMEWICVILK